MTQLSTDAAITRFQQNEERVDKFANELGTYLASNGVSVLTIRQFIANMISRYYAFNVKGAWTTATVYAVQDIVSQGGIEYMCLVAHTAGTFATDLAAKKWVVFQGVTQAGAETLENKSFKGAVSFFTNGSRIGITSENAPLSVLPGLVYIKNNDAVGAGLVVASLWEGSTAEPYVNNDTVLFETYNRTSSNSANRSWAASCSNAYHDVPAGITDSGTRVGAIGWAVSVNGRPGYDHYGTIEIMHGLEGTSGFQGPGHSGAVIKEAAGVRGLIYADNIGGVIERAFGVIAVSDGVEGGSSIGENYGVYSRAKRGTVGNWSFYGEAGELYNEHLIYSPLRVAAGTKYSDSSGKICARFGGNGFEFGYPDVGGYGSNAGATFSSGYPFLAFCAEADPTGDTFRTRGKKGTVILDNLAGSLIFGRLTNANASGQGLTEDARLNENGQFVFDKRPVIASNPPASANAAGIQGEVTYDSSYVYVCVAPNTWKRSPLSTW